MNPTLQPTKQSSCDLGVGIAHEQHEYLSNNSSVIDVIKEQRQSTYGPSPERKSRIN